MALPPGLTWRRVHPITPALEGWKIIAGVLAIVSIQNLDEMIEVYRALKAADFDIGAVSARTLWLGAAGLVALLVIGAVVLVVQWRSRSFAVDEAGVYRRNGILAKQLRIARLPRIQSVDIVHPLLGRIFGLGQLVVEVAGGGDSRVTIGYLRTGELEDLREQILDLAAGAPTVPVSSTASSGPGVVTVPGAVMPGTVAPGAVGSSAPGVAGVPGTPGGAGATDADPTQPRAEVRDQAGPGAASAPATGPLGLEDPRSQAQPMAPEWAAATGTGPSQPRAEVSDQAGLGAASAPATGPLGFEDLAAPVSPAERERMAAVRRRLARPEETPLYEVDPRVLVGSIVWSVGAWLGAVVLVAVAVFAVLVLTGVLGEVSEGLVGALVPMLPAVLAVGGGIWSMVKGGWGFRAAATPAGIRVSHGLTDTVSSTLPPGRVHAVRLRQGPLWRGKDWWKVEVTLAGRSGAEGDSDSSAGSSTLLPVGERDTALRALWLVVPDLGVSDPAGVLAAALTGMDDDGVGDARAPIGSAERGFVRVSPRSRLFTPLGLRRTAVIATDTCLIRREGRLWRRITVVPYARIQSFKTEQGPWARKRGLAGFSLDMVAAGAEGMLNNLEAADVAALRDVLARRCLASARAEHLDRWLARVQADAAERQAGA